MSASKLESTPAPYVLLCFLVRKEGLSFEQFKQYYEEKHAPLVLGFMAGEFSPVSYTRQYIDHSAAAATFPYGGAAALPYDCITTVAYKDQAACEGSLRAFAEHQAVVQADEKNFLDSAKTLFVITGQSPTHTLA